VSGQLKDLFTDNGIKEVHFFRAYNTDYICATLGETNNPFLRIEEKPFKGRKNANEEKNKFGEFIAAALDEKWERDFGKPLRWKIKRYFDKKTYLAFECPKCERLNIEATSYCPHCGVKLDPPEDAK